MKKEKEVTKREAVELKSQSYKIKIFNWIKLIFFIYIFILSIELIKKSSLFLASDLKQILLSNFGIVKAICVGWFSTAIVQSSGAIGSITATFAGNGIITLQTAVYILIGSSIGATMTALIISLIVHSRKKRDFRHGFEIGFAYTVYVVFLLVVVIILESLFGFFSKISFFIASKIHAGDFLLKIPDLTKIITDSVINLFFQNTNKILLLIIGFIILILTLRYIGKAIIDVLGGEHKTRKFIDKNFKSKYRSYLIGFILTAIVFSSGITIGLLVPLAVSRVINLKKTIPFILGAKLGTGTDILLAALFIGKVNALACAIAFFLFAVIGTIIFLPNTNLIFKTTKYLSKKVMHISRKKAILVLLVLILIPLLLLLIL
ncbi:MAG: hypothetical protein WC812_01785 [Candidatus Pacearchaeota archaeon]|jgi:Na+/phosphate symporter